MSCFIAVGFGVSALLLVHSLMGAFCMANRARSVLGVRPELCTLKIPVVYRCMSTCACTHSSLHDSGSKTRVSSCSLILWFGYEYVSILLEFQLQRRLCGGFLGPSRSIRYPACRSSPSDIGYQVQQYQVQHTAVPLVPVYPVQYHCASKYVRTRGLRRLAWCPNCYVSIQRRCGELCTVGQSALSTLPHKSHCCCVLVLVRAIFDHIFY